MGYRRHIEHLDEERVGYLEVCGATCFVDVSLAPTLPKPVQGHLNPGLARGVAFRSDAPSRSMLTDLLESVSWHHPVAAPENRESKSN
jgi:hypothetical protein